MRKWLISYRIHSWVKVVNLLTYSVGFRFVIFAFSFVALRGCPQLGCDLLFFSRPLMNGWFGFGEGTESVNRGQVDIAPVIRIGRGRLEKRRKEKKRK